MMEKRYIDDFGQLGGVTAWGHPPALFLLGLSQEVILNPVDFSLSLIQVTELISEKRKSPDMRKSNSLFVY